MGFKSFLSKLLVIMCLGISFPIYAQDDVYLVKDNKSGLNESFASYSSAKNYYKNNLNNYDNLLLYENDKLLDMEYGVICFSSDKEYIDYYSISKKEDDVISSKNGVDAAYLESKDDEVYFVMANDYGYTDIDNVTLIPYEELSVKISTYHSDDTYLYHNIKTQLEYEYYSSSLKLDYLPEYLDANKDYFSYDGHYFYDDFYLMIDDYRLRGHNNAINEEPYYNYFMYLPYRSLSNYSYLDLEDYFYNTLKIDGKLIRYNDVNLDNAADEINRSQLYGEIDDFFVYQNIYGANALMLISGAINESSYGKSFEAFNSNRLYETLAYDTYEETINNRYNNVSSSIYAQAKYFVSNRYSNIKKDDYCGSFVGDRYSGITSTYNLDQYYGERLAATYFEIDNKLGSLDYNAYQIGIIDSSFTVFSDENLSTYKYDVNNNGNLAYIILEEYDDSYLVQLDYSDNSEYLYCYDDCVGYIDKDEVAYIINYGTYRDDEYVNITYDFDGGTFIGEDNLSIKTRKGSLPAYIEPSLDGYEFIGYDNKLSIASEDTTYLAKYKQISDINISYLFEKQSELYPSIDLSKATLNVKYADGTSKKITITSDMLEPFETSVGEHEIVVNYCGLSTSKTINIDDSVVTFYQEIEEAIEERDYESIKDKLTNVKYPFRMSTIRDINNVLMNQNNRNYVINDNTGSYDISVSGLDLSLSDMSSLSFFKDTYYVEVNDIKATNRKKIAELASGYDLKEVCGININFKFNFQNIQLNGPIIVQLNVEDKQTNEIYTVYHLDEDGNIIKCRTTHSNNYVQFVINEAGDYLLLKKIGSNEYNIEDGVEDLSLTNMGYDNHRFNLNVLTITLLLLICFIGVIVYYIIKNKKEFEWKDYRKSLQKADTVQEEKPKN